MAAENKERTSVEQTEIKPQTETPIKPENTIEDFEKLLESEKRRSQDYLTRLQYLQADYENIKKRFDRETEQIRLYGSERIITELLDVVDELELAVKVAQSAENPQKALIEGVEMTLKKLRKVLEQEGVCPIEDTVGKVFDPCRHDAIAAECRDDVTECTVIEEIRKGYLMRKKILRPTIVRVAKPSK
ncbi:MAG TPA: nucleotide exchange factor GrpE [Candidatus Acidoferrales bacterium]|nr:nucleotide exchange factor GrpE [Candidatus Acidoferrales bacterium]